MGDATARLIAIEPEMGRTMRDLGRHLRSLQIAAYGLAYGVRTALDRRLISRVRLDCRESLQRVHRVRYLRRNSSVPPQMSEGLRSHVARSPAGALLR